MNKATPTSNVSKETWGPYELRPNPAAIFRLAIGTSCAIATALCVPDAFAILPSSPDFLSWSLRLIGLWLSAAMLWSVSFLAILHLLRIAFGGIRLDAEGIKLWRFAKKIPWTAIVAVSTVERRFFSRLFFIRPAAMQMILHVRRDDGKGVASKQIPSFQFLSEEFTSLLFYVSKLSLGIKPQSASVCIFQSDYRHLLKKPFEESRLKQVAIMCLISFSLVFVLAKRAAVNYTFNMGNKEFNQVNYGKASEFYEMATAVDPAFAPAWDRLARCEYRLGNKNDAVKHWHQALLMKPDYVESKLGLSAFYLANGEIDKAEPLIKQAIRLAPKDEAARLNLAQLKMLRGKIGEAVPLLEGLAKPGSGREQAQCLLAQCYVKLGNLDGANKILEKNPSLLTNSYTKRLCLISMAQLAWAQGRKSDATKFLVQIRRLPGVCPEKELTVRALRGDNELRK